LFYLKKLLNLKIDTMTLNEFIQTYDVPGSVILLEGKREVLEQDCEKLKAIGELLASRTQHITFRSGNAGGSDELFATGVAKINPKRMEVITPFTGHRKAANKSYKTHSLDNLNVAAEAEVLRYSKTHKATAHLVKDYTEGKRDRFSIKAAYIIRDTVKVVGTKNIPPASFGIFYDDLKNPKTGGTGHTMNVCALNKVPLVDQRIWFKWLTEQ
jgi:hypothetical protein